MRKLLSSLFILLVVAISAVGQERTITGTVTDQGDKSPLPGVSVRVKGTTVGTQTGANGEYSLKVPAGSKTLTFTYIGYATKDVAIGSNNVLNVGLDSDATQLGEVVVTALGISRSQRAIGYSVSKVDGGDLSASGEANVIQGLAAKATGVQVTSSSGTPGASSKIILRGPATFNGDNQPLIVIDGVPMNNDVNNIQPADNPYNGALQGVQVANRALDINPEDIESVSILKGPAAAAIYGQAAGNGAIIYTTKRGKARNGIGVTYSNSTELQTVSQLPKIQTQYGQGSNGIYSGSTPNSWGPDLIEAGTPTFDNLDNFFQTGKTYNNNLSVNGGNDNTNFRVSFGATNMDGIVPNSKLDRYSLRLTGDTKLNSRINIGGTINYTNTSTTLVQNGSNLAGIMLPLMRMPVDFDGRNYINADGTQNTYFSSYDNPFFSSRYNPYDDETDRVVGNVSADAKLSEVFALSWKVGADAYSTNGRQVYAYSSLGNDAGDGTGQVNKISNSYRNLYSDLLLKVNKSFGAQDAFTLSGMIGGNFNYSQNKSGFARGYNLAIPGFYGFSGLSDLYFSDSESFQNSKAVFADATLDYKNILFLTLTGRNEWSTTFGEDSKGFFYPKADISYVFSHLLKNPTVLSYGKIRFAYANVGISPSVYQDRTYFGVPTIADGFTNGLNFPYLGQNGYAIQNVFVQPGLKPERNEGLEAGLELKFLNGRVGLDATVYQQTSTDLLLLQPIAPTSGFEYKFGNLGQIRNKGVELGLNADVLKAKDFSWNAAVNWSKNNNEVVKLAPGVTEITVGSGFTTPKSYAIVGKPFGVFYGTKFKRDANGNVLINSVNGRPLNEETEQDLGSPIPDWLMNINNSFTYKDFSFSFLWDIRQGGKVWNGTGANLHLRGKSEASAARLQTYVIPGVYGNGPNEGQPNTNAISAEEYFQSYLGDAGNELAIQDGSWVRLRSVNLSYRYNIARKLPKSPLQFVELGASLRNVLLFTDYTGVDPETSLTGSNQNLSGYDYFNNPGTKSVIFNLRVGF